MRSPRTARSRRSTQPNEWNRRLAWRLFRQQLVEQQHLGIARDYLVGPGPHVIAPGDVEMAAAGEILDRLGQRDQQALMGDGATRLLQQAAALVAVEAARRAPHRLIDFRCRDQAVIARAESLRRI